MVQRKLKERSSFFLGLEGGGTANVKDSEVIKKVHGFWVIQLKN